MRLSTRFGLGAALAVLPLLGVVAYSIERMQELARSNERLTKRQVIGLQIDSGIITRLDRLEEYARKYRVSKDGGYLVKFEETTGAIEGELVPLEQANLSAGEAEALGRFAHEFRAFARPGAATLTKGDPYAVSAELEQLVSLALEVQQHTRRAADAEAAAAAQVRRATPRTALAVAAGALALSVTLLWLTVRSLRTRLGQFVRAHHAVSQGAFSFQLDPARDDELGQVARAFNRMVDELDQLERIKADFISSVSHELRTPLVAMLETNLLLLDELLGPLTPKQRTMIELNTQAAQRLSSMITDLLDLSRLKAGIRYSISEHDMVRLTRSAVSELEAMALDRQVTLSTRVAQPVIEASCDPDRYVQLVQNLVENALKYTPAGGVVEVGLQTQPAESLPVEAHVGDRPRECALLTVDDTGPGIPAADRKRVFEKFFRRQGLPSDGGAGLGLAICREIAEAHGGSVWVADSARLGGASLHVALPVEPAQRRPREAASS